MFKYMYSAVLIPVLFLTLAAPINAQTVVTSSSANAEQVAYLYNLIAQLQAQLAVLQAGAPVTSSASSNSTISIRTGGVSAASNDSVKLEGTISYKKSDDSHVWFEYGKTTALSYSTGSVEIDGDSNESFVYQMVAPDLDNGSTYYYRAVAQDDNNNIVEGSIVSFKFISDSNHSSNDDDDDDKPSVDNINKDDVSDDSAELNGDVEMNDFENGIAFMVYGEDEDSVEDVADENEYNDVDEQGDDLQKILLASNLDDDRSFTVDVLDLDENTEYFFRLCVEYEDEDDDEQIACSEIEAFETDN